MTDLSSLPYLCSRDLSLEQVIENDVHSVISSLRRHSNPTKAPRHSWRGAFSCPGESFSAKSEQRRPPGTLYFCRRCPTAALYSLVEIAAPESAGKFPGDP